MYKFVCILLDFFDIMFDIMNNLSNIFVHEVVIDR